MAVHTTFRTRLSLAAVGNFVILPCGGVTKGTVQATRIGTGSNITTTLGVTYSLDGAIFVAYATPKTISFNSPTGSNTVSPIQVGALEPYDLNAGYLMVAVASNAASGDEAYIDLLAFDSVTPGVSVATEFQSGQSAPLVFGGEVLMPPSSSGGGSIPTS